MNRAHRWLIPLVIAGPLFWFFGPALFGAREFAFRDVAHYYAPLFQWLDDEWRAGRVPLWNPLENCGVPVLADATSSVFYPGKLLFCLPLGFATRFKLYIVAHVLLAAVAAYRLARHWRASPPAAALCALSFAFGGQVLFQYCNVVFLVGAAWLPLALLAGDRMLARRSFAGAIALAVTLAMMILGGDPQAAYHAGLLLTFRAWLLRREERKAKPNAMTGSVRQLVRSNRFALLSYAAIVAFGLAAVQMMPTIEWTSHSDRAAFEKPRSIFEMPSYLWRNSTAARDDVAAEPAPCGVFGSPPANSHGRQLYEFSVGPWRLAECVWPNSSGRLFPTNRRWLAAIPAEGRVWTPSLYFGLLPLGLALWTWRVRGGDGVTRWLSWSVLWFVAGSFGWFGVGWLVDETRRAIGGGDGTQSAWFGEPVGGAYWFMTTLLPGYVYFRYPAKLLTVASLALSLLAARGFDRLFLANESNGTATRRLFRGFTILSIASAIGAVVVLGFWPWSAAWTKVVPADEWLGPLDRDGAFRDLLSAFLHTTLVGGFATWLVWRVAQCSSALAESGTASAARREPRLSARAALHWGSVAIVVTAVDLCVANGWLVATAPADGARGEPAVVAAMRASDDDVLRAARVFRGTDWLPADWAKISSADRLAESLAWDRATLFPKHHLPWRVSLVESPGTLDSLDHRVFLDVARPLGPLRADGEREPAREALDLLSARFFVLPTERGGLADVGASPAPRDVVENSHALPRAWIAYDVVVLPPLRDSSPTAVKRRTEEVLAPGGKFRNWRRTVVLEPDDPSAKFFAAAESAEREVPAESCQFVRDEPGFVELEVRLPRAGVVVLGDTFYPGWTATVTSREQTGSRIAPILRANRILRGVTLPAGEHRVSFRYQPRSFWWGAVISGIAWLAVVTFAMILGGPKSKARNQIV